MSSVKRHNKSCNSLGCYLPGLDKQVIALIESCSSQVFPSSVPVEFDQYDDTFSELLEMVSNAQQDPAMLEDLGLRTIDCLRFLSLGRKFERQGANPDETPSIQKWIDVEAGVSRSTDYWNNPEFWESSDRLLIARIRLELKRILGPAPSYDEVGTNAAHGPGVAAGVSYAHRHPFHKWDRLFSQATCTCKASVQPYLYSWLWNNRQFRRELVSRFPLPPMAESRRTRASRYFAVMSSEWLEQDFNILFTVPKTTTSRRPAAKEPLVNVALQRGLGICIRNRLRDRTGIDLQRQDQRHAQWIRERSSMIATIDLSAASDSLNLAFLRQILDPSWMDHIDRLRARFTLLPTGDLLELHKVSSMGNGFTFELETAIFLAIVMAGSFKPDLPVLPSEFSDSGFASVFGDDIIIPNLVFDDAVQALVSCGFSVNQKKSHGPWSPIRESCGWFSLGSKNFELMHVRSMNTIVDLIDFRNRIYLSEDFPQRESLFRGLDVLLKSYLPRFGLTYRSLLCDSTHYSRESVIYCADQGAPDSRLKMICKKDHLKKVSGMLAYMLTLQSSMCFMLD